MSPRYLPSLVKSYAKPMRSALLRMLEFDPHGYLPDESGLNGTRYPSSRSIAAYVSAVLTMAARRLATSSFGSPLGTTASEMVPSAATFCQAMGVRSPPLGAAGTAAWCGDFMKKSLYVSFFVVR